MEEDLAIRKVQLLERRVPEKYLHKNVPAQLQCRTFPTAITEFPYIPFF